MQAEDARSVGRHAAPGSEHSTPTIGWWRLIYRNMIAASAIGGILLAVETGYFSNDRTPRTLWSEMERLKSKGTGRPVYEANFGTEAIGKGSRTEGYWDYYNGASNETTSIQNGSLVVNYTAPWIGAFFMHTGYEPSTIYRVVFEANVEGQPAAILMRNRQLDHMRQEVPLTNGEFKEFTAYYVTANGSLDQTRIIFMPNNRANVRGKLTIRKFRIEKMAG